MLLTEILWLNVLVQLMKSQNEFHTKSMKAEAIARLWEGASPREEAFKSVGLSKEKMDKLFRAQAASELECF